MRFIVLIILLASCAPKAYKLTPPKTDREKHVFKYTDLYIAAQLSGKNDSANYYLNLALKYDSVVGTNIFFGPVHDTIPSYGTGMRYGHGKNYSFSGKECQHVFTAVEADTVSVSGSYVFTSTAIATFKYGKHSGKQLVCVKCFCKVNQVIDYGERPKWVDTLGTIIERWNPGEKVPTTFSNQNVFIGPIYDTTPVVGTGMAYPHGKDYKKDKRKKK